MLLFNCFFCVLVSHLFSLTNANSASYTDSDLKSKSILDACSDGDLSVIKIISQRRSNLKSLKDDGNMTCLHFSAKHAHFETVRYLLDSANIDINAKDEDDSTALHVTVNHCYSYLKGRPLDDCNSVLELLLSYPGIEVNQKDKHGYTAFQWAIRKYYGGFAKILANSPNVDTCLPYGADSHLEVILKDVKDIHVASKLTGLQPNHIVIIQTILANLETEDQMKNLTNIIKHAATLMQHFTEILDLKSQRFEESSQFLQEFMAHLRKTIIRCFDLRSDSKVKYDEWMVSYIALKCMKSHLKSNLLKDLDNLLIKPLSNLISNEIQTFQEDVASFVGTEDLALVVDLDASFDLNNENYMEVSSNNPPTIKINYPLLTKLIIKEWNFTKSPKESFFSLVSPMVIHELGHANIFHLLAHHMSHTNNLSRDQVDQSLCEIALSDSKTMNKARYKLAHEGFAEYVVENINLDLNHSSIMLTSDGRIERNILNAHQKVSPFYYSQYKRFVNFMSRKVGHEGMIDILFQELKLPIGLEIEQGIYFNYSNSTSKTSRKLSKDQFKSVIERGSAKELKFVLDYVDIDLKDISDPSFKVSFENLNEQGMSYLIKNDDPNAFIVNNEKNYSPLHLASERGYFKTVDRLCRNQNINLDVRDTLNRTPLIVASQRQSVDVVKTLIDKGADIGAKANDGWTALMYASSHGRVDVLNALLNPKVQVNVNVNAKDNNGWSAILLAIEKGHIDVIKALIKYGADLNSKTNYYWNSLMIASQNGHVDLVKFLVDDGVETNARNNDGWTALMIASQNGHNDVVKTLIDNGTEMNARSNDGWTALMIASANGHIDVVESLVTKGAELFTKTKDGWTALMFASQNGHTAMVQYLIDKDFDVNYWKEGTALMIASKKGHIDVVKTLIDNRADLNARKNDGWTALMFASQNGHIDVVESLVTKGAEMEARSNGGWTAFMIASANGHNDVVKVLITYGAEMEARSNGGWTALMIASQNGHIDVVKTLIDNGADLNARNHDGQTALIIAFQNGQIDIMKDLVENNADIDDFFNINSPQLLVILAENGYFESIDYFLYHFKFEIDLSHGLRLAIQNGHLNVVNLLIQEGVNVNSKNNYGLTALMIASGKGHIDVVKTLIDNGADLNARKNDGWTALMFASENGHIDVVKTLIDKRADLNARNNDGWTALMIASQNEHNDVVKVLIANGAELFTKNKDGWTALMIASQNGHLGVVETLIANGAKKNARNNDGWTALMIASQNGHIDVVKALIKAKADISSSNSDGQTAIMIALKNGNMEIFELLFDLHKEQDRDFKFGFTLVTPIGEIEQLLL